MEVAVPERICSCSSALNSPIYRDLCPHTTDTMHALVEATGAMTNLLYTVASGDLRLSANQTCWPTQAKLEDDFAAAVEAHGWSVRRGHPVDEQARHGFIDSQRAGIEVFKQIPPDAPLV